MLAVSPLRSRRDARENEMETFSITDGDFPDFATGNLLDSIDFDDLFVGISDGDSLPDLEMDPEILAEFSSHVAASMGDEFDMSGISSPSVQNSDLENNSSNNYLTSSSNKGDDEKGAAVSDLVSGASSLIQGDEIASKSSRKDSSAKGKKSSAHSKNPPGKKKVKVDWTPELHRRFVQAVEQLGVDKAVPSRILELMGIDCLTRHNIASHLQKYRSHRKHLLAREAEAANWSQRRQIYGGATPGGGVQGKRDVNPWIAPTIGFPPATQPMPHFRPLHVWGHPSMDQSMVHIWPKHVAPVPPPPHAWPPTQPPHPADLAFWHPHQHHVPTPGTPCYPPHLQPTRYPPVPGIPPPGMFKVEPGLGLPNTVHHGKTLPKPPSDVHPSKESVDAAIGDALSKPWLPLPLGLKPPSIDSVMVELQRQGVSKIPPSCA